MTAEELESREASLSVRAWFRERVLESIKPLQAGKRRPVFRPTHVEIAMNTPHSQKQNWKERGLNRNEL